MTTRQATSRRVGPRCIAALLVAALAASVGCVSNRLYHPSPDSYLVEVTEPAEDEVGVDLAVIEFDEFGMLWLPTQLEDAVALIERRNADSARGIMVVTYTHGWQNNARPDDPDNDLARFREGMRRLGREFQDEGAPTPDHVVGVYLGWRGATSSIPFFKNLTFWSRKSAAARLSSYPMREVLFRVTRAAKARPESKVLLSGHSMGGMILGDTLGPALSTLLLAAGPEGVLAPTDLVLLQNPALDGLAAYQLIEYLKREGVRAELRDRDGAAEPAPGPVIASITSRADWVTRLAYPAGRMWENLHRSFRRNIGPGVPEQGRLANRAHGHLDFLVSHRARLDEGVVALERVPGAYNDTPFWIVQTDPEICSGHSDIQNEHFLDLVQQIAELNRLYETGIDVWLRAR